MDVHHPNPRLRAEQPIEKAARLISEDRVALMPQARVYHVLGDSGSYHVVAGPDGIHCPCPARAPLCSHVLAVAQIWTRDLAQPEPSVEEMDKLWKRVGA